MHAASMVKRNSNFWQVSDRKLMLAWLGKIVVERFFLHSFSFHNLRITKIPISQFFKYETWDYIILSRSNFNSICRLVFVKSIFEGWLGFFRPLRIQSKTWFSGGIYCAKVFFFFFVGDERLQKLSTLSLVIIG